MIFIMGFEGDRRAIYHEFLKGIIVIFIMSFKTDHRDIYHGPCALCCRVAE